MYGRQQLQFYIKFYMILYKTYLLQLFMDIDKFG